MKPENHSTIKMLLRSGQVMALFSDPQTTADLANHPKFAMMSDDGNTVYMSVEDIVCFEILENRINTPEQIIAPTDLPTKDIIEVIPKAA